MQRELQWGSRAPWRFRKVAAVSAAVTMGLTGFGQTASAAPKADSALAASPSRAACVTGTKKIVAAGDTPIHPKVPTIAVKARPAKGKLIVALIQNAAIGAYQFEIDGLQAAAKAAGLKLKVLDAKGTTPNIIQDMEQAIALHPAAIIDDDTVSYTSTQLVTAAKDHIPVIDATGLESDLSHKSWHLFGEVGSSRAAYIRTGTYAAAEALSTSGCSGTYVQYNTPTIPTSVQAILGTQATFKKWCPTNCKLVEQVVAPDQLVTGVGPLAQTYVTRFSDLKAFFLPDQQLLNAHASVDALHWKGELVGYFDSPFTFSAVRSGVQYADVSTDPEPVRGWAAVDMALRAIAHQKPIDAVVGTQLYIVTKQNVPKAPADDLSHQYGNYQHLYLKTWGLGH